MIWTLFILSSLASAEFTPLPADTPESVNNNFKTIDEEIRRLDAVAGGALTTASSPTLTGTWVFLGPVTMPAGSISISTFGYIPENEAAALTNTALGPAVLGSTLTIVTTVASRHLLSGLVQLWTNSGGRTQCTYLRDGEFRGGSNSSTGIWLGEQGSGTGSSWVLNYRQPEVLPAGTYIYTLTCANTSGNYRTCTTVQSTGEKTVCWFEVSTIP